MVPPSWYHALRQPAYGHAHGHLARACKTHGGFKAAPNTSCVPPPIHSINFLPAAQDDRVVLSCCHDCPLCGAASDATMSQLLNGRDFLKERKKERKATPARTAAAAAAAAPAAKSGQGRAGQGRQGRRASGEPISGGVPSPSPWVSPWVYTHTGEREPTWIVQTAGPNWIGASRLARAFLGWRILRRHGTLAEPWRLLALLAWGPGPLLCGGLL